MTKGQVNSKPIQNIGHAMRTLAIYMVIAFIIAFFLGLIVIGPLYSAIPSYSNISEFVYDMVARIRFLAISLFIVSLIELIILYNLIRKLAEAFETPGLNLNSNKESRNFISISILLNIIGGIVGWITLNFILNDLITNASGSIEDFERVLARAQGAGIIPGLINAIAAVFLVLGYGRLKDYFENLNHKYRFHLLDESSNKLNTTKIGAILLAIASFIKIIPGEGISGVLSLPGVILIIYGLYTAGSALSNFPDYLVTSDLVEREYFKPYTSAKSIVTESQYIENHPQKEEDYNENYEVKYLYCIKCGRKNVIDANFCNGCGIKLAMREGSS